MKIFKRILSIFLVVVMIFAFSACVQKEEEKKSDKGVNTSDNEKQETKHEAKGQESVNEKVDPLGKYDPEIELTTVKVIYPWMTFPEGDSIENNNWTRHYKDMLGINVKFLWTAPEDQYKTKLNASIASGDIPDVMLVDESTFNMCIKSKLIQELDKEYENYASEDLKKKVYGGDIGQANLNYGKVNGKLMALPGPMSHPVEGANILYIRKDWLDKLDLPEPDSLNDVFTIIEAFATKDPDGNGKDDTFGIGISNDAIASGFAYGIGDVLGIYNGYHAHPGIWLEDSNGKLVYGTIQPEMKPALSKLHELFKAGYIDKEFGVKDRWKVGEDVAAGKIGLLYGVGWTPVVPLVNSYKNDSNAVWEAYPIPSIDEKPAYVNGWAWGTGFYVVSKNCKNPEAIIKIANLSFDTMHGKYAEDNPDSHYKFSNSEDGKYPFHAYQIANFYPGDKNLTNQLLLKDALDKKDPSNLPQEVVNQYNSIIKWLDGDRSVESWNAWHLKESLGVIAFNYYKNNHYLPNKFNGLQTPTMLEKMKTLDDMASKVFTKIIMEGNADEEFAKFVDNWNKMGGEVITQEVNDWYNSIQ